MADDVIEKSVASERRRILAMLKRYETMFAQQFYRFVQTVTSEDRLREVRLLLQAQNFDAALAIVDSEVIQMANIIPRIFARVGQEEVAHIASVLAAASTGVAIAFDVADTAAAALMAANRLEFIREFTRRQREVTREALKEGLTTGQGIVEMVSNFRQSIGLTSNQMAAVRNYRRLLSDTSAEALTRALRDRRFDGSVQRAIDDNDVLSREQINRMVEAYRRRSIQARGETIARTEVLRTTARARDEALRQSIEQTGTSPGDVVREWISTDDDRVRDTHREMNGQRRGLNQAFDSPSGAKLMRPGDPTAPPEEIINCRCALLHVFN